MQTTNPFPPVLRAPEPGTAWAHLPNAAWIDEVLRQGERGAKRRWTSWKNVGAQMRGQQGGPQQKQRSAAWDKAYREQDGWFSRTLSSNMYMAVRHFKDGRVQNMARMATLALCVYPEDAATLILMEPDALRVLVEVDNPCAVLLYPAVVAMRGGEA